MWIETIGKRFKIQRMNPFTRAIYKKGGKKENCARCENITKYIAEKPPENVFLTMQNTH